jgi:hypothetical protein
VFSVTADVIPLQQKMHFVDKIVDWLMYAILARLFVRLVLSKAAIASAD